MRVYICDDEKLILKELAKEIKCYVPEAAILCFDTGSKLLEKIKISVCDILFLDIDMPEIILRFIQTGKAIASAAQLPQ